VPLGQNHARPSCTARARPAATWAQPVLMALARPTWPRPARVARGGGGAARRPNGGAPPAHGRRLRKRGGSPARGRRRGDGSGDGGFRPRWSGRTLSRRRREGRGVRAGDARLSGRAADAARSRAYLSSRAHVRTAPPTAANHGSARRDTATDRRAPRVSRISNLNKSLWMKIARRK
jgi:hypothetical protein